MKFYLSSYKLGNEIDTLKALIPTNKKTAFISNALDFSSDLERRKKSEQSDIDDLAGVGLDVKLVDLRDYFDRQDELEKKLSEFGVIWVRGGNVFVLREAMKRSGFDVILKRFVVQKGELLYGGYSAGVCILAPTLRGIDLVDDPTVKPYGGDYETIFEGLGIIGYSIIPHYQSNHPESEKMEMVVEYMKKNEIPFKTLKDGEVIII